jgi:[CysO sulfur-carrier protein]-S-L-cysteine hydrolase
MGSLTLPGRVRPAPTDTLPDVLLLTRATWMEMVGHAYDGLPDEACGLFAGPPGTDRVTAFYPCRNAAESSRVYTIDPKDHLRADRDADGRGLEINGVMHSHTHTDAYPSPTDVAQAPDPGWHYVIVSLRQEAPVLRSYRIVDAEIREETVSLSDG